MLIAAAALLSPSVLFGQKLMKENGIFIIDLSNMHSSVITKTPKNPTTTATNTSMGSQDTDISSAKSNETLYYKFEIIDEPAWRQGATWMAAIETCQKYEIAGRKNWRLPTQKELVFLGVFNSRIVDFLGCSALTHAVGDANGNVWTATEHNETLAWRSIPVTGEMWNTGSGITKKSILKFVCIREIP